MWVSDWDWKSFTLACSHPQNLGVDQLVDVWSVWRELSVQPALFLCLPPQASQSDEQQRRRSRKGWDVSLPVLWAARSYLHPNVHKSGLKLSHTHTHTHTHLLYNNVGYLDSLETIFWPTQSRFCRKISLQNFYLRNWMSNKNISQSK